MKKIILFVVGILAAYSTYAQIQTVIPVENRGTTSKSDNVISKSMQIGGGVNTNISAAGLFTGSTSINVPIYKYNKNNVSLGVSLNSNTKGVKLTELSGSYGLHWNLSGGGYIIKTVNDIEDERSGSSGSQLFSDFLGKLNITASTDPDGKYIDSEYDEYSFSVGGYSFTFYKGSQGYVFVSPDHEVKIEEDGTGFIATDIYGNKYFFEHATDQAYKRRLFHRVINGQQVPQEISIENKVWVLKKVEFPNKEVVIFKYLDFKASYYGYLYCQFGFDADAVDSSASLADDQDQIPLLKEVVYPNHDSVVLDYYTSKRCDLYYHPLLNKISIYNNGASKYGYKMHYTYHPSRRSAPNNTPVYFQENTICDYSAILNNNKSDTLEVHATYRLLLDSIQTLPLVSNVSPQLYYKFTYNDVDLGLPGRLLGSGTDYWGYYNGEVEDLRFFPEGISAAIPNYYTRSFAHNLDSMKIYSIKTVTNQLGLTIEYEYDMHVVNQYKPSISSNLNIAYNNPDPDFSLKLNEHGVIGRNSSDGLRLKSIKVLDPTMPDDNMLKTEFTYEDGITFLLGGVWHHYVAIGVTTDILATNQRRSYYQMVSGSNLGYSKVTEKRYNSNNELLSSKEVHFSNVLTKNAIGGYDNYYNKNGDHHYFEAPYAQKSYLQDYKIGLLLKEITRDEHNFIINEREVKYTFLESTFSPPIAPQNTFKLYRDSVYYWVNTNPFISEVYTADNYDVISGKALVSDIVEKKYYSNTAFTEDITTYEYDAAGNLLSESTYMDTDEYYYVKRYYYPQDFIGSLVPGVADRVQNLMDRNILNEVGYKVTKNRKMASPPDPELVTDASFNTYVLDANNDVYVNSTSTLVKGSRSWDNNPSPIYDNEQANGAMLMTSEDDLNGYISTSKVTRIDGNIRALEIQARGAENYATMRYDTFYKAEVASCNTRFNDFAYIPFDVMVEQDDAVITYDKSKIKTLDPNTTSALTIAPQSGRHCLRLEGGEQVTIDHLNGQKAYVVSCWVTNARSTPPQNIMVKDKNDNIIGTLQLSANHKYGSWHYYQATVLSNNTDEQLTIYWDEPGTVYPAVWIDNIVVAPLGASYNIQSFNTQGQVDMEGGLNGKQVRYQYDAFGRPVTVSDENGNVKESYHYKINR